MANEELITDLASKWYQYVCMDHHKDRDCHFGIEIRWSYGNPPTYQPWHHGYVADTLDREEEGYPTLEEAQTALIEFINAQIKQQREWALGVLSEEDTGWDSHDQARKFIELFGE